MNQAYTNRKSKALPLVPTFCTSSVYVFLEEMRKKISPGVRDLRLPPRCRWDQRSSGILRNV